MQLLCFEVFLTGLAAEAYLLGKLAVATETELAVRVLIVLGELALATGVGAVVSCALEGGY